MTKVEIVHLKKHVQLLKFNISKVELNAFKETRIYKTIDFRQLKIQVYLHTSAIISNKNKNEFRNEKKNVFKH